MKNYADQIDIDFDEEQDQEEEEEFVGTNLADHIDIDFEEDGDEEEGNEKKKKGEKSSSGVKKSKLKSSKGQQGGKHRNRSNKKEGSKSKSSSSGSRSAAANTTGKSRISGGGKSIRKTASLPEEGEYYSNLRNTTRSDHSPLRPRRGRSASPDHQRGSSRRRMTTTNTATTMGLQLRRTKSRSLSPEQHRGRSRRNPRGNKRESMLHNNKASFSQASARSLRRSTHMILAASVHGGSLTSSSTHTTNTLPSILDDNNEDDNKNKTTKVVDHQTALRRQTALVQNIQASLLDDGSSTHKRESIQEHSSSDTTSRELEDTIITAAGGESTNVKDDTEQAKPEEADVGSLSNSSLHTTSSTETRVKALDKKTKKKIGKLAAKQKKLMTHFEIAAIPIDKDDEEVDDETDGPTPKERPSINRLEPGMNAISNDEGEELEEGQLRIVSKTQYQYQIQSGCMDDLASVEILPSLLMH